MPVLTFRLPRLAILLGQGSGGFVESDMPAKLEPGSDLGIRMPGPASSTNDLLLERLPHPVLLNNSRLRLLQCIATCLVKIDWINPLRPEIEHPLSSCATFTTRSFEFFVQGMRSIVRHRHETAAQEDRSPCELPGGMSPVSSGGRCYGGWLSMSSTGITANTSTVDHRSPGETSTSTTTVGGIRFNGP